MKLEDIRDNMIVVCKKPHPHERSINSWVSPEMDNLIGKPMKVVYVNKNGAFCEAGEKWADRWYYDIEWLDPWTEEWIEEKNDDNREINREEFMNIVYSELNSDPDNNRANTIIDAADEYVDNTMESLIRRLMNQYDDILSIGDGIIKRLKAMRKEEINNGN